MRDVTSNMMIAQLAWMLRAGAGVNRKARTGAVRAGSVTSHQQQVPTIPCAHRRSSSRRPPPQTH
jgi:hypothetical protein